MEKTKPKVTVAHLTYNYNAKADNMQTTIPTVQTGYHKIELPGEGKEVQERMHLAILNKATQCGLYNIQTITPEEYETGLKWVDLANKQEHEK